VYGWIWRRLPGGVPSKVIGSAILGRAPLLFDLGHERVQIVETELAASMLVH